jgi:hypothetical protein
MAEVLKVSKLLLSVKELLGIPAEALEFDGQIVTYINMAIGTLTQVGFGDPSFLVTKTEGSIEDFIPDDEAIRGMALIYIYTKVRLLFDPPSSSFVLEALKASITEYEWRLQTHAQYPTT